MKKVDFCWCGIFLDENNMCRRHKLETMNFEQHQKLKRQRQAKYSGASKRPFGAYENN